jgi:hypothetical protein
VLSLTIDGYDTEKIFREARSYKKKADMNKGEGRRNANRDK